MFERDTNEENNEQLRKSLAQEGTTSPEKSDTQEPQIENIGIDGSQRFSDIRDEGPGGLNNNSESMIVFNPKKEIKSTNPNLFSQVMTSQENQKFKEMLNNTKGLNKENQRLRDENKQLRDMLNSKTLSTLDSDIEKECQNLTNKLYAQKQSLR